MSVPDTTCTVAGYLSFIRNVMVISEEVLPDNSIWVGGTFNVAYNRVNPAIRKFRNVNNVPPYTSPSPWPTPFALAVYNLAGDRLINFAQDLPDADPVDGSNPAQPYFAYMRSQLKILSYVGGTVQSTSDEGTSVGLVVPKAMENFTLADLQNLKTPWGRNYMGIAQEYGPSGWGLS